jgi:hypothetical protein
MTKTKILRSISEQMADQYKLRAHYLNKSDAHMADAAHHRAWSIYWCGLELLGESYHDRLDEARTSARQSGERFADMLENL